MEGAGGRYTRVTGQENKNVRSEKVDLSGYMYV